MTTYNIPVLNKATVSSATYNITDANIIFCNTTSNAITLTLPSPSVVHMLQIKRIVANGCAVTINPNASETIEGGSSLVIGGGTLSAVTLVSDNTDWWVV